MSITTPRCPACNRRGYDSRGIYIAKVIAPEGYEVLFRCPKCDAPTGTPKAERILPGSKVAS